MNSLLTLQINDYHVATFFWNIFLAFIPCLIAYRLSTAYHLKKWSNISWSNKLLFSLTFLIWFFFFPNTAYLFTDVRHLADYCDDLGYLRVCAEQAWVVPIFFSYGLVGVPTFYYSLRKMSQVIQKLFGKWAGGIFPVVMIPLTALGLLLGLVARFNSWEVLSKPWSIVQTAFLYLQDETMLFNLLSYSLMLYLIYYVTNTLLRWHR